MILNLRVILDNENYYLVKFLNEKFYNSYVLSKTFFHQKLLNQKIQ